MLTSGTRYAVSDPAIAAALAPVEVGQELLNSYVDKGVLGSGSFVKSYNGASVYALTAAAIRPLSSWSTLVSLAGRSDPVIVNLSSAVVAALPTGPVALAPGQLYRSEENPTVYLIDGLNNRIPLGSFDYSTEAGFTNFSFTSAAQLDAYSSTVGSFTYGVQCGAVRYVSAGGQLHTVTDANAGLFPFTYQPLDAVTCALLKVGSPALDFIRTPNGSIYQLVAGQKRPITSMNRFTVLNGSRGWMSVSERFATLIPTGPAA